MKNLLLLPALLLSLHLFAQFQSNTPVSYTIGFGGTSEMYSNMSIDFMKDVAQSNEAFGVTTAGYEYNPSAFLAGTMIEASVSFIVKGNTSGPSQQIRFNARYTTDRESMVNYYYESEIDDVVLRDDLIFCLVDDEFGLGADYLWRQEGRIFAGYAGFGIGAGTTFNSDLLRIRGTREVPAGQDDLQVTTDLDVTDNFDAKSSAFWRFQIPIGLEVRPMPHLALGMEYRIGTGGQQVYGGNYYGLDCADAFTLRLSYLAGR